MSAMMPTMADLLERAGFQIRGRRANCIHCDGHSRLTVAFNDKVCYCHRCQWTGNLRTIASALGLRLPAQRAEDLAKLRQDHEFKEFEDTLYMVLLDRWWYLKSRARMAEDVLAVDPEWEPAWDALADFYHNEAVLTAAFETLSYEKVPIYLEQPMTRARLRAAFEEATSRSSRAAA